MTKLTKEDIRKMAELTNNEILSEDECSIEMGTSGFGTILFDFDEEGSLIHIIA